ncbi:MAG: helix-turn-helix transcriptional regulator, partial [Candidatus Nitrosotenuis sp.]
IQEKLEMAVSAYDNKKYTDAENLAHEARTLAEEKLAEVEVNNQNSNPIDWFKNNIVGIATSIVAIGGAVSAITLLLKKTKSVVKKTMGPLLSKEENETESVSESEIDEPITLEMRDDDKQLVSYLEKNGGQAFERDLRKKFLLPRTTMWRAVKRLERQGVIEIQKKDFQNLVRLKTKRDSQ